jgi:hypothetical protein
VEIDEVATHLRGEGTGGFEKEVAAAFDLNRPGGVNGAVGAGLVVLIGVRGERCR